MSIHVTCTELQVRKCQIETLRKTIFPSQDCKRMLEMQPQTDFLLLFCCVWICRNVGISWTWTYVYMYNTATL